MLVLSRKKSEQIQIGDNITITVLKVKGSAVQIGVDAPGHVKILRSELSFDPPDGRGADGHGADGRGADTTGAAEMPATRRAAIDLRSGRGARGAGSGERAAAIERRGDARSDHVTLADTLVFLG